MIIQHEKKKLLLIMGAAYILLVVGIIGSVPLHTSTDELGAMLGAAVLAGRDWSGVINNSGYYGFGYYTLFFWIFKLTDSPFIIYRVIIVFTAFLRVLMIPIAYYIAKEYLNIDSERILYGSAFLMPFLYTTSVGVISNEYILELLVWVIILLVCKVFQYSDNGYKKWFYIFLLVLSCFYSLFIHTRALTLIIAICIVVTIWGILRKKMVLPGFLLGGSIICYFVSQKIISAYQLGIYGLSGEQVRNGSVQVSSKIQSLNLDNIYVWLHMLLGIIHTEVVVTCGLFLVCVIIFFFYMFYLRKNIEKTNTYCNAVYSISILCMGATIAAFMVSGWFDGMTELWGIKDAGKNYAFKSLTYIRYWSIYVPQFVLCSISIVKSLELNIKKIFRITAIGYVTVELFFIRFIIPIIQENGSAASPFFGIARFHFGDIINKDFYYKALMLSMTAFLCILFLVHSRYKRKIWVAIVFFLYMIQLNHTLLYDAEVKEKMSLKINASYEEKCKLDEKKIKINNIYLNDLTKNTDANWSIYSIAQFYFNEYTLQNIIPNVLESNDIIISTGKSEIIEKKYEEIFCYILDDNEVWYTYLKL